jgi:thioredoxin-like negative regulator of GroEL
LLKFFWPKSEGRKKKSRTRYVVFLTKVAPTEHGGENIDELFEQAQFAEEAGDIAEAERLYRVLMKSDPTDASAPFNLGNMLRADGRNVEDLFRRDFAKAPPTHQQDCCTTIQ